MFRNAFRIAAPLLVVGFLAGTTVTPAAAGGSPNPNQPVVTFAKKAGFNTLVTAIKTAELTGTLNSGGPWTVFAPTDEAFEKLEMENPGTIAFLLANPDELRKVLLLHVVEGEVRSGAALGLIGSCAPSLNGDLCFKSVTGGVGLGVNNATVTAVDIDSKNAVIHVVDTVIMPEGM